jgi:hypothetical protein
VGFDSGVSEYRSVSVWTRVSSCDLVHADRRIRRRNSSKNSWSKNAHDCQSNSAVTINPNIVTVLAPEQVARIQPLGRSAGCSRIRITSGRSWSILASWRAQKGPSVRRAGPVFKAYLFAGNYTPGAKFSGRGGHQLMTLAGAFVLQRLAIGEVP